MPTNIANTPPSVFRHFPAGFAAVGCWRYVTAAQCAFRIDIAIEGVFRRNLRTARAASRSRVTVGCATVLTGNPSVSHWNQRRLCPFTAASCTMLHCEHSATPPSSVVCEPATGRALVVKTMRLVTVCRHSSRDHLAWQSFGAARPVCEHGSSRRRSTVPEHLSRNGDQRRRRCSSDIGTDGEGTFIARRRRSTPFPNALTPSSGKCYRPASSPLSTALVCDRMRDVRRSTALMRPASPSLA
jgi:hypothetical protein